MNVVVVFYFLFVQLSVFYCFAAVGFLLNGSNWTVHSSPGDPKNDAIRARVPGDIFLDLYRAGNISDPYIEDNDVKLRWVGRNNWTYRTNFTLDQSQLQKQAVVLFLRGLDTVASVYINNKLVLTSANMFREFSVDLKQYLHRGNNDLEISFESPEKFAFSQCKNYQAQYGYATPPDGHPPIENGIPHVNFIRKMQSSFSWDWGPGFGTVGIWRDIFVLPFDECILDKVSGVPTFDVEKNRWVVNVDLFVWCAYSGASVLANAQIDGLLDATNFTVPKLPRGLNRIRRKFAIDSETAVDLWWPNGYGPQPLYNFTCRILTDDGIKSEKSVKIGFRRVYLVQKDINAAQPDQGMNFYFKINSVPIFIKGSNWIPADSFLSRISDDKLEFMFESMVKTYTNAIRVWGGGIYESDYFYELADKHGILIWQDIMFAVALYPASNAFLKDVAAEVRDQVDRLKHHPSILLWAGSNENELGLRDHWYQSSGVMANFSTYKRDYLKLYNSTVWGVVNDTDFYSRPYLMSSPSNGLQSIREGGVAKNPASSRFGDVHYYNYDANAWRPVTYPIPRCASEFGFQSLPSKRTLASGVTNSSWSYFGSALLHRQHHPSGNLEMLAQVLAHFRLPKCTSQPLLETEPAVAAACGNVNDADFLDAMIYLTQIHQAVAYQTQTEHYRRWRNRTDDKGQGNTMCALYWQLNDIWQAPTWATIDFGMNWKMAHYYSARFFAPVIVSPLIEDKHLSVFVVSDLQTDLPLSTLLLDVLSWQSTMKPVFTARVPLPPIRALSSTLVYDVDLEEIGMEDANSYVFRVRLINDSGGADLAPENVLLPNDFQEVKDDFTLHGVRKQYLGNVSISRVSSLSKSVFSIELNASAISPFVWLETDVSGYFSDNGFTITRSSRKVKFHVWKVNVTLAKFKQSLTVKSLRDFY